MAKNMQVIEETGDEVLLERAAAIDVAKGSGKVCVRLPNPSGPGRRQTKVWDVASRTAAIAELADELAELGTERVVLEATSDYWRPFFYLLEARGLVVWLVNARDVKNVPGRPKTDKLDAVWLAKLNERGMLRPSFVPPAEVPRAPRLHPLALRPGGRTQPLQTTHREIARRRLGEGIFDCQRRSQRVVPGHARGPDRR